jgi:hypothetical protein
MHAEGMQIYSKIILEVTCMYRDVSEQTETSIWLSEEKSPVLDCDEQIMCRIWLTSVKKCMLQACTPYDPVEAGRARMEALLRRLQEMGFGFEAAKGALKTATREGLLDQPALERAAELLMSAGAG